MEERSPSDTEVVDLCSQLIRIDSTNFGEGHEGPGERQAAEYVAELLSDVGIEPHLYEHTPRRTNVLARWGSPAADGSPPLLIHAHLDVVPSEPADWRVHPLSGEVLEGCVWGRGAVDMKDFNAMLLTVIRDRARSGRLPRRELVLAFTADEEAGGEHGARLLVENRADWLADCSDAVGEVGGYSVTIRDRRLYLIQAAEKGMAWMKLSARGRAGHGSMLNDDNAVSRIAGAVARIAAHDWPIRLTPTMEVLLAVVGEMAGVAPTPDNTADLIAEFGGASRMLGAVLRNTTNPTVLQAGYKTNVIPSEATARVDGRFLPGEQEQFLETMQDLCGPGVEIEFEGLQNAWEEQYDGRVVDAMTRSLLAEDPGAVVAPYLMSGGTDAKHFRKLGLRSFGFTPLRLPADLDFTALFHGVDERVPIDALEFGVRVFDRFLDQV